MMSRRMPVTSFTDSCLLPPASCFLPPAYRFIMNDADCTNLEAAAERTGDALRFTEIPRTSRLFNDFLYDYDKVARFYTNCGRTVSPLAEHAHKVGAQSFDRAR